MKRIHDGNREPGTGSRVLLFLALMASSGLIATAQHDEHRPPAKTERLPDPGSRIPADLGWEPIRCWRQSSAGAITIGEAFSVVVTCAVYEADNAQVIPDESRLNVASIQMAPFEILGGSHPPDVHRGSRRFFQYTYQLRIIGPDAIGHDVNIPPLVISYRIHSRVGAAATLEGRDLSYLLPMMPVKVLSMVPNDASDIRDASEASLATVDSLRFRSSLFRVLTITFGALAAVMMVLALVPLARPSTAAAAERDRIPDRVWLSAVISWLHKIQEKVPVDGWTDGNVGDALSALRLVAAAAIEQPVSQKPLSKPPSPEGRMIVQHGLIKQTYASVSSPVTAGDVARATRGDAFSTTRRQQLEGLQVGLSSLTMALYCKEPVRDAAALDEAVRHGIAVARDLAQERSWWKSRWARR